MNKRHARTTFERLMKTSASICWFASVIPFMYHIAYVFLSPVNPNLYHTSILSTVLGLSMEFISYWLFQVLLYIFFGIALQRDKLDYMICLSFSGAFFAIIHAAILGQNFFYPLHESMLWSITAILIWVVKRGSHLFSQIKIWYLFIALVGFGLSFIRDYYSLEDATGVYYIHILSFIMQKWLRSFAILFTSLWFFIRMNSPKTQNTN